MHRIGKSGQHARQFSQRQQQRYQVGYGNADSTQLHPPQIQRSSIGNEKPNPQIAENMSFSDNVPIGSVSIQREPESSGESLGSTPETNSDSPEVKPEEVAERVYQLLLKDTLFFQERSGKRFIR